MKNWLMLHLSHLLTSHFSSDQLYHLIWSIFGPFVLGAHAAAPLLANHGPHHSELNPPQQFTPLPGLLSDCVLFET